MTSKVEQQIAIPRRRWFQFRLATLFVVTSLCCVLLVWIEYLQRRFTEQTAICQQIWRNGGTVKIRKHWASSLAGNVSDRYAGLFDVVVEADCTQAGISCNPRRRTVSPGAVPISNRLFANDPERNEYLAALRALDELECLNLSFTSASERQLSLLDSLKKLTALHLTGLKFGDAALARLVERHPNLRVLGISGTNISNEGLRHLVSLGELTSLDVNCPQITNDGLDYIGRLNRLEHLDLPPGINNEGLAHLRDLTNLRTLDLSSSDVTDDGLRHLGRMTKLEVLRLEPSKVGDRGLVHLAHLKNLRVLELSGGYPTRITDAGLSHLAGLIQLERLQLTHRNITDAGLLQLAGLINLRTLDVRETQVTGTGAGALLKKIPSADVLYR